MSNYPMYICKIDALIKEMQSELSADAFSYAIGFMEREIAKLSASESDTRLQPSHHLPHALKAATLSRP